MILPLLNRLQEERRVKLTGGLYHFTQISLRYNSNRIEGSRLTEDQTRYIFETNSICTDNQTANVDDIIETKNHFACFDYMLGRAGSPLLENIITSAHKILKSSASQDSPDWFKAGGYKAFANEAEGTDTAPPSLVRAEMDTLLRRYNQLGKPSFEDITAFHYRFEKIHPFQDGNGRVGRLVLFRECLRNGIQPFIIDEQHKLFYYRGLREFDRTPGYLLDTCRSAQDRYEERMAYFDRSNS
ncbi:MAG: Fic family protein [Treponema sp.]|jgi:Fic family protein|nr:Fic family protein [Treponema sp.]